jgi:uncharacterized membrane protein
MNAAHLHLMINHAPVMGAIFSLLLTAWAAWRRNGELDFAARAAWVGVSLAALAAFVSGNFAEDVVEDFPGVSAGRIASHEDAAKLALAAAVFAGVWALGGIVKWRRRPSPKGFTAASLLFGIVVVVLMAWTANLGGQIRHQEARPGWTLAQPGGSGGSG